VPYEAQFWNLEHGLVGCLLQVKLVGFQLELFYHPQRIEDSGRESLFRGLRGLEQVVKPLIRRARSREA